jgi:hypothetical protein
MQIFYLHAFIVFINFMSSNVRSYHKLMMSISIFSLGGKMRFKKAVVNIGNQDYNIVQFNYAPPKDKKVFQNRIHFIQILDRSGSMSPHIDKLIDNVKSTIDVMEDNDLLSVVWFSGPGQCKVLLKGASPKEQNLRKQLDTLKSTIGTTCFSEALGEVKDIIKDLGDLCDNFVVSLFTDGQPVVPWREEEEETRSRNIVSEITDKILAFNTVGYGGYYNINFLKELASLSKFGRHAHSTKITEYLPIFKHNLKSVEDISNIMFYVNCENSSILYLTNNTSKLAKDNLNVNILSRTTNKFYIIHPSNDEFQFQANGESYETSRIKGKITEKNMKNLLYAMSYEEYYKGNTSEAIDILEKLIKDKYLVKLTLDAFTAKERQKATDTLFIAAHNRKIKTAPKKWAVSRLMEGLITEDGLLPAGVCVMDLLQVFEKNGDRFIPLSSEKYRRIGKKVVDNYNAFKRDKDHKLSASFKDLVFTKEKLNISIRYEIPGFVTINPRQAKAAGFKSNVFNAKIYREQTIIKDGDINIDKFQVLVSEDTLRYLEKLNSNNFYNIIQQHEYPYKECTLIDIDLSKLPVMNRNYVLNSDSLDFILDTYYKQRVAECRQKVVKYFIDIQSKNIYCSKNSSYTKAQVELLKSFGLDASGVYSGIDNKPVTLGTDQFEGKFFEFGLKGFSNLPKVEDVINKLENKKKLTPPETMMSEFMAYLKENNVFNSMEKMNEILEEQKTIIRNNTRILAQVKLAKALTGGWWQGLKLDSKENYLYERAEKTLVIKVVKKLISI